MRHVEVEPHLLEDGPVLEVKALGLRAVAGRAERVVLQQDRDEHVEQDEVREQHEGGEEDPRAVVGDLAINNEFCGQQGVQ